MSENKAPKRKNHFSKFLFIILGGIGLSACSTSSNVIMENGIAMSDPFEEQNRIIMSFNQGVDKAVIYPTVKGYRAVTPKPVRKGFSNFLTNLSSPMNLANQILQGDIEGSRTVLLRAIINTTVGVGGLFDVAGHEGIELEQEDFGQTLAVWGVDHGPYMVLPFIGPSSLRDYTGYLVDSTADPLRWYAMSQDKEALSAARFVATYLNIRDSFMDTQIELEKSSFDYYAAVRSTYYQYRRAATRDQKTSQSSDLNDIPDIPDYDDF